MCVVLFCSVMALSASADATYYIEFAPGVSLVGDADVSGGGISAEAEFDAGFVVGGAVGARVREQIRSELAVDYREAELDKIGGVDGAADIRATTVMANVYYDASLDLPVVPYLGVGIGVAILELDPSGNCVVACVDDTTEAFAWNIMAGVAHDVAEHVTLSIGYRYVGTTEPEFQGSGLSIETDDPLDIHEFRLGLRYSF